MNISLEKQIIDAKNDGLSDKEIGEKFGVNLKFIEKIITKKIGINISRILKENRVINNFSPKNFILENNTVWSFKSRGIGQLITGIIEVIGLHIYHEI